MTRRTGFLSYTLVMVASVAATAAVMHFMPLRGATPAAPAAAADTGHDPHAGMTMPMPPGDDGSVFISADRQQLIGVRMADVSSRTLQSSIRGVGTVAFDETRVVEVHTRIAGWVDRTDVDFVGKPVSKGAPLFSVYSPELVAAEKEHTLAVAAAARLAGSAVTETREGAGRLVAATRERLHLLDVSDAEIGAIEKSGAAPRTISLTSPIDGVVLDRKVVPGQYVTPEMAAYRLADLRSVWVIIQVFEHELPGVAIGDDAVVEVLADGATSHLTGRVSYIYPDIDPATRRARVRVELANADGRLMLDSFATVELRGRPVNGLVVPREAVIDTGARCYVILARGDGHFLPREVQLGPSIGEFSPVLAGLHRGDRVVTSAQFLIDSESNLMAAMHSMAGMDMTTDKKK